MNSTDGRTAGAMWLIASLLGVIAACLVLELGWGSSPAVAQTGVAGRPGFLAVAGLISNNVYGLYLVDTEKSTMALYQWNAALQKLKLMAARNFAYDLQLDDYNNETESSPQVIRSLVGKQSRMGAQSQPRQTPE